MCMRIYDQVNYNGSINPHTTLFLSAVFNVSNMYMHGPGMHIKFLVSLLDFGTVLTVWYLFFYFIPFTWSIVLVLPLYWMVI